MKASGPRCSPAKDPEGGHSQPGRPHPQPQSIGGTSSTATSFPETGTNKPGHKQQQPTVDNSNSRGRRSRTKQAATAQDSSRGQWRTQRQTTHAHLHHSHGSRGEHHGGQLQPAHSQLWEGAKANYSATGATNRTRGHAPHALWTLSRTPGPHSQQTTAHSQHAATPEPARHCGMTSRSRTPISGSTQRLPSSLGGTSSKVHQRSSSCGLQPQGAPRPGRSGNATRRCLHP